MPHRKGMAGIPWYDSQSVLYHLRGYSLERPMIMAYAEGTRKFFRPISMPTTCRKVDAILATLRNILMFISLA